MKSEIWLIIQEDKIEFGGICKVKDFKKQIKKLEEAWELQNGKSFA